MTQYSFTDRAKEHFSYLMDDYGYSVAEERYEPEAFGNSLVRFHSRMVDISIVLDRGQVLVDISPYLSQSNYQFGLPSLLDFLRPGTETSVYVFPETWEDYDDMVEQQLVRLAHTLREDGGQLLTGEFSDWEAVYQREKKRAEEGYRKLTGKDPIDLRSE